MEATGNHEPLVHVLCWEDPVRFSDTEPTYMEFPITEEDHDDISLKESVLFQWRTDDAKQPGDAEWNYCLRLAALESAEIVNRNIVQPVIALLQGKSIRTALPKDMKGLVHFAKTSEPGQYRIVSAPHTRARRM